MIKTITKKNLAVRNHLGQECFFFTNIYYPQINDRNKQEVAVASNLLKAADVLLNFNKLKKRPANFNGI